MRLVRWTAGILCVVLIASFLLTEPSATRANSDAQMNDAAKVARQAREIPSPGVVAPSVQAKAAALIDVSTGRILYVKNADQRMPIASLTKIVTAITAIENGKLKDEVTVGPDAVGKEGSSIYLRLGEKLSLEDLLYAIMLRSGNDAATAVADHVGGSVDKFAKLMNAEMAKLALSSSHFVNPHGLDNPNHYSTAHDMAVITAYALHQPDFAKIVSTKYKRIPWPDEGDRVMKNKNKMLVRYPGADGVKTGYTKIAGRCLVASATRNGRQLAVVVLNDPDDWNDTTRLLNAGFSEFPPETLVSAGQTVRTQTISKARQPSVNIVATRSFSYPLTSEEVANVRKTITFKRGLHAPIRTGQVIGDIQFSLGQVSIGSVPLTVKEDVQARGLWAAFVRLLQGFFQGERSHD